MAKSSRASSKKANHVRLKKGVFGPVEAARNERLSAKLLEIASQPKPVSEQKMDDVSEKEAEETKTVGEEKTAEDTSMDVDETAKPTKSKLKGRIVKRRGRKSGIVFPKFGDRNKVSKRK